MIDLGDVFIKENDKIGCYLYIYEATWELRQGTKTLYYTGITSKPQRRWTEHATGTNSNWLKKMNYLHHKKPESVEIKFQAGMRYGVDWRDIEIYIQNKPPTFKKALIMSQYNDLQNIMKNYNPFVQLNYL